MIQLISLSSLMLQGSVVFPPGWTFTDDPSVIIIKTLKPGDETKESIMNWTDMTLSSLYFDFVIDKNFL